MKNTTMRKLAGIAAIVTLASCMMAPMGMTAFAANTYSITISSNGNVDVANHTFEAYQIFKGTYSDGTLSNIDWGANITDGDAFIAELQANATLNAITEIADLAEGDSASTVAEALATIQDSSETAAVLADVISELVSGTPTESDGGTIDLTTAGAGYYFVQDATDSGVASGDAKTKFILEVVGAATAEIKTDAPTLVKKIWHNDTTDPTIGDTAPAGDSWGDVGDNQIGDTVYYYTQTSVPDMSDYETYKYIIRDSMCAGLTYGSVTNVVYVPETGGNGAVSIKDSATITVGDDDTTDFTETFTVSFADLKDVLDGLGNGGYIYTYYTATLNANAKVSDDTNTTQYNENIAYLEYSNNPNASGAGDTDNTGETPEDIVYDWTFTTGAEKVDADGAAVAGAAFTLYEGDTVVTLEKIADPAQAGIEAADDTVYYRVSPTGTVEQMDETTATVNKFVILGLDDTVTYTLKETKVPATYNDCEPTEFTISSGYNTAGNELTALTSNGTADLIKIINNKGSVLPSTGGIGTTLFYVIGGTMAAGAGVYLISKKRMNKED